MNNALWTTRAIDAPAATIMDATEVAKLIGVSRDTFDGLVKSGEFPTPMRIGKQTNVWGWRDVTYYLLRIELGSRLDPKPSGTAGKSSETAG